MIGLSYDKLAEKHNLDDVITQILREQQIDPALVERLLASKMDPFDIAETALDFGGEGLRAIETMAKANVQPRAAMAVLSMARDMGISDQVIALVNSGKLESLQGLKEQIAAALKGKVHGLEKLSPKDTTPGVVRVKNAISAFLFQLSELQ